MVDGTSTGSKRQELRKAVVDLRDRGLYQYAKWTAEQLNGLPQTDSFAPQGRRSSKHDASSVHTDDEEDTYLLAKTYFDLKEYRRAANHLLNCTSPRAIFLRCYATYLAGERRKEEERIEAAGPLGKAEVSNQELDALDAELSSIYNTGQGDAFTTHLYALVLLDKDRKDESRQMLLTSLEAYPCNWAAWTALLPLCDNMESVSGVALPRHWMRDAFMVSLCVELQDNTQALSRLEALRDHFPRSEWIAEQTATVHYNLRNFDEAQELFETMLEKDQYRIENMDSYSNILYVKEQFAKLSHLAHTAALTDKYRPETCCIIGNYYSLKGQHEKAVMYFRRALKLNLQYLSAWTLMGHEYVEMKNPPAAIEAYRRAVDINPRDYRAWYGLGQTYELVQMPYYALYYFRRAANLRPADARMYCAMAQCYEQLNMDDKAIRCYRRAVALGDREGIAMHKLAKLYERRGESSEAAHYFKLNLERIDSEGLTGSDMLEALQFLAEYCKDNGQLTNASDYCTRLLDFGAQHKEKAKQLLREIRQLQQRAATFATPGRGGGPQSPGSDLDMSPMT